ncbi:hypothetical protein D3C78_1247910 [compost metagenome]
MLGRAGLTGAAHLEALFSIEQQLEQREHARRPFEVKISAPTRAAAGLGPQATAGGKVQPRLAHDQQVRIRGFPQVQPRRSRPAGKDFQLLRKQSLLVLVKADRCESHGYCFDLSQVDSELM